MVVWLSKLYPCDARVTQPWHHLFAGPCTSYTTDIECDRADVTFIIRLTIKKRMSDCCVLGCRLVLILDDLLWVLTDDQLKAALHFADSLSGLLKRATSLTQKVKGARKLEVRNMGEVKVSWVRLGL